MDIREQILIASHDLFYKQGFHACGVELLAQHAATTKRTLYAHFGSKDGLIDAVLEYRHEKFMAWLLAALDKRPAEETDLAYLDFMTAWTRAENFYGCMFINASAEYSDAQTLPHRHAARHKAQIRAILSARLQHGGFKHAETVAELLFVYGEGMIVAAQTTGQPSFANSIPAVLSAIRHIEAS